MNSQDTQTPQNKQPGRYQPPPVPTPQQPLPPTQPQKPLTTESLMPVPPGKSKKPLIIIALIVIGIILLAGAVALLLRDKNQEANPQSATSEQAVDDKQGVQQALDKYCQELGKAFGFQGLKGYIVSDRLSEDVLNESPEVISYKQVGDTAISTVDCEDANGPKGIVNDLLFAKQNGSWSYVDEEQNSLSSGFLCTIVDQYEVSKELVSECSPSEGAKRQSR